MRRVYSVSFILALMCGPRHMGISDSLALNFTFGARSKGAYVEALPLRGNNIRPCVACGNCRVPPHNCILADDDAEKIFLRILGASLVVFSSPIYFYALPALFKCLIDRCQRFWEAGRLTAMPMSPKPAITILCAGREFGRELFSGAKRTLNLFIKALGMEMAEVYTLRGMDAISSGDVSSRYNQLCHSLFLKGQQIGSCISQSPCIF